MNRVLGRFAPSLGMREWARGDRGPIIALALIVIGFFLPALVSDALLIWPRSGLGSDISYRHWPDLTGYAASLRGGRVPLWDSSVALGRPLAGNPGELFLYPLDLFFVVLPPALAFNVLNALHVFLSGLFTFLLLRVGYDTSRPAALLAGLTFAFAPKYIAHLAGGHVGLVWGLTWAPAVLFGLRMAFRGSWLAAVLAGLALALQMPTHIQMPYYTAAIGSAFWLWHAAPAVWRAASGGGEGWKGAGRLAATYAVWLMAFVLLAAAVLFPLLQLLPSNSRTDFSLADSNLYALPPALLVTLLAPSEFQFPEWTMYVGLLPLLLAAVGWFGSKRGGAWFFGLLACFALIYAVGTSTPLSGLAFTLVPGFRLLRVPTRLWFFGGLAVAALAGFGVDAISEPGFRNKAWQRRKWLARAAGVYFVAMGAALAAQVALFRLWPWQLASQLASSALIFGAAWAWIAGRLRTEALRWLLVPLVLSSLLPVAAAHIELASPQETFLRSNRVLDFLAVQPGTFRVYSTAGDLPYALAAERGVESLEGLLAFQIGHAVQAIRQAAGCGRDHYATAIPPCLYDDPPQAIPDADLLGQLNVRYVVSRAPLGSGDFELVLEGSPAVYENRRWRERARLEGGGSATIVGRREGEYDIVASPSHADRLILSETWLPGWRAWVDGAPAPVDRVGDALIGLKLEPGGHRVRLSYEPLGWQIGWPVSLAAWAGLALWVGIRLAARARARPPTK